MNRTSNYATGKVIAKGQITLVDLTDIISQPTPPVPAKEDMLWMDTSKTPPVLMVYKSGKWVKQNDFKDDPEYSIMTEKLVKNSSDIEINKKNIELKVTQSEVTNTVITEIGKVQDGLDNQIAATVSRVDLEYYLSTSNTTPTGGSWSTSAPVWVNGKFMWSRTKTYYVDVNKAPTIANQTCIAGAQGNTGATGQSIASLTPLYKLLDNKTQQPTPTSDSGWSTTCPAWVKGKYIHTCTKLIYKNPAKTEYTAPTVSSEWEAVTDLEGVVDNKFTEVNDKFAQVNTDLEKINISVGDITTANYANCVNSALEFIVGTGSGIASDVKTKVKDSNIPLTIKGDVSDSEYLTITSIQSLDSKGAVIDTLDFGKGLVLMKSKTNASIYDELGPKGIHRKISPTSGEDLGVNNYYYDTSYLNLIKVVALGKIKINCNLTTVSSTHIVPLTSMASIENAVAGIDISKNQISQKVNVNGVIGAINIGIEDEESNILIMADRIKLKGAITIEALDKSLADGYIEESGKTMINGGMISAKSLKLTDSMQANGVIIKDKAGITTFSVEGDTGAVNIKGNISSMDFTEPIYDENGNMTKAGTGWKIERDGTAIFNEGEFRSKVILPRAGMSNEGSVRIWAGSKIAANAPFRVMDNGDIFVEKGNFKGVFSGDIKVGGITISDNPVPGVDGRSRALIEIRDDKEKVVTSFADDSTYIGTNIQFGDVMEINQNDVLVKTGRIVLGNSDLILNPGDTSISFKNSLVDFKISESKFNFIMNGSSQSTDFIFANSARDTVVEIQGQLKVKSNVDIGIVTIRKTSEGIDFLFI